MGVDYHTGTVGGVTTIFLTAGQSLTLALLVVSPQYFSPQDRAQSWACWRCRHYISHRRTELTAGPAGGVTTVFLTAGQSLPLALLAVSTLRMKCFWSPYICIFASLAVSYSDFWTFLIYKVDRKYLLRIRKLSEPFSPSI